MPIGLMQLPTVEPADFLSNALSKYSGLVNAASLPQKNEASIQAKLADAMLKQIYASMPFGGKSLPGVAGQVAGLEAINKQYGANSPQASLAQQLIKANMDSTAARVNYQNVLAGNAPIRALTPQGKMFVEQSNVNQGASPAGTPIGQPVAPGMPAYNPAAPNNEQGAQYSLEMLNKNIPASVKNRNLFATNIEKTLAQIDPESLTRYAGLSGSLAQKIQQGRASIGKEDKEYDDYLRSVESAKLLSKQVRQFYGDSIQPSVAENLEKLSNPATWKNNPKLARALFDNFKNILGKELQTYRDATLGTDVYTGNKVGRKEAVERSNADTQRLTGLPEGKIESTQSVDGKNYVKINGKWYPHD